MPPGLEESEEANIGGTMTEFELQCEVGESVKTGEMRRNVIRKGL